MARPMETLSGTECLLTFEEHVERFRSYVRDPEDSVCTFLCHFLTLWKLASRRGEEEGEGVSDYEASVRLLRALPPRWTSWATAEMRKTDFARFAANIMYRWVSTYGR